MNRKAKRQSEQPKTDPTKMANQPALQTSSGRIWLVVGGIFAVVSLVPFVFLIFAGSGRSTVVAIAVVVAMIVCFGIMVLARVVQRPGPRRLKLMATAMLTMAGIALVGMWICAVIEAAIVN